MSGEVIYELPIYTVPNQVITLYATGILSPQGVTYSWFSDDFEEVADTVKTQGITITIPEEVGEYSISCYAKKSGYYSSLTTMTTTTINPQLSGGSIVGLSLSVNRITDPRDGEMYMYAQIGNLDWFTLNLRYAGTPENPVGCAYEHADSIGKIFGRLYSWNEATSGVVGSGLGNGPQGVCPDGWSVPTAEDWEDFGTALNGGVGVSFSDKWTGLAPLISAPVYINDEKMWPYCPDFEQKDDFGWNAMPCGNSTGTFTSFENLLSYGFWWSSAENEDGTKGRYRYIWYNKPDVPSYVADKSEVGFAVRCVRLAE